MRSLHNYYTLAIAMVMFSLLPAALSASACSLSPNELLQQFSKKDHHWFQHALGRYAEKGHRETQQMLHQLPTYTPFLEHALEELSLPSWLKYVTLAESRLQIAAESPAGAAGLWQLMPATARSMGLRVDEVVDERLDPILASQAAALLLADLYQQFDNWLLALAAYNCGPAKVRRAIRRTGSREYAAIRQFLPGQTRRYIPRVLAVATIAQQPSCYGFQAPEADQSLFLHQLSASTSLRGLARQFGLTIAEIAELNPAYRQGWIPFTEEGRWAFLPAHAAPCFQPPVVIGIGTWLIYQVQAGDSLHGISQNSGYSVAALEAWNQLPSSTVLPGQALFVPIVRSKVG